MNFFDSNNGEHRIANIYIENNGDKRSKVYEYLIDKQSYISTPGLYEQITQKAKSLNATFQIEQYQNMCKIKFLTKVSDFEYFKTFLFNGDKIVYAHYMTKEEGEEYGKRRNSQIEKQAYITKAKDEAFKKKISKSQVKIDNSNEPNELADYQNKLKANYYNLYNLENKTNIENINNQNVNDNSTNYINELYKNAQNYAKE